MRHTGLVRGWVPVSAGVAPVALIGGWTLAAGCQGHDYSAVRDTISALAAHGATDRWIMTTALVVLGTCHLMTAAGLTEIGRPSRMVLGLGGVATLLVAARPQPDAGHAPAATVAFLALALWPAVWRPGAGVRLLVVRGLAVVVQLALLGWLVVALQADALVGLSERVLAGTEALIPLAFVAVVALGRRWVTPTPGRSTR